jgi:hypothetical protein
VIVHCCCFAHLGSSKNARYRISAGFDISVIFGLTIAMAQALRPQAGERSMSGVSIVSAGIGSSSRISDAPAVRREAEGGLEAVNKRLSSKQCTPGSLDDCVKPTT